jgi:hypothetical protein
MADRKSYQMAFFTEFLHDQVQSFDEFMYWFDQPGVHHAYHYPNRYCVPMVDEDLSYWNKVGSMPSSEEVQVTRRAHKRISSNFHKVLVRYVIHCSSFTYLL